MSPIECVVENDFKKICPKQALNSCLAHSQRCFTQAGAF